MIDPAALRALSLIADTGSVAGAADTLGITPSAVSQPVSYTHLDVYKRQADPSGTPRPGRTGWIKPAKGPVAHFTVVRADRAKGRFDLQTRFPGATMHIEHELRAEGAGTGPVRCELVHRVRFSGPGTPVWSALVGRAIALGLPKVMASIVDHARGRVDQQGGHRVLQLIAEAVGARGLVVARPGIEAAGQGLVCLLYTSRCV